MKWITETTVGNLEGLTSSSVSVGSWRLPIINCGQVPVKTERKRLPAMLLRPVSTDN